MAKTEDVTIKTRASGGKLAKRTVVQYTFAESLDEAKEWYGDALCKTLINKAIKVGAQAVGRPLLLDDKSQEEIQAAVSGYKPEEGSRRGRVKYIADMDTLKTQFAEMPPAERTAMLAMFEAYLRGEDTSGMIAVTAEENGDDDDEESDDDDEEGETGPGETGSPPSNANRAQRGRRGPQYD